MVEHVKGPMRGPPPVAVAIRIVVAKNNDNLLYDPNNYFYFNGHKFLSLRNIKEMKENRNEEKDTKDNNLIIKIL